MQNNNVPDAGSVLAWGIVALAICACPVAGLILAIDPTRVLAVAVVELHRARDAHIR